MTTAHNTCFEMWVSSSLGTSASLRSKLLRYRWGFGDDDPENRLLGLEIPTVVGDPDSQLLVKTGTISFPVVMCFLSGFRGPRFVSTGSGFNGEVGSFCLIRSRARSAAISAFSLLILINVHGLIWMSSFLPDTSILSLSILIDSFRVLCVEFEMNFVIKGSLTKTSTIVLSFLASYLIQFIFSAKDTWQERWLLWRLKVDALIRIWVFKWIKCRSCYSHGKNVVICPHPLQWTMLNYVQFCFSKEEHAAILNTWHLIRYGYLIIDLDEPIAEHHTRQYNYTPFWLGPCGRRRADPELPCCIMWRWQKPSVKRKVPFKC